jgi:hypothetical protein
MVAVALSRLASVVESTSDVVMVADTTVATSFSVYVRLDASTPASSGGTVVVGSAVGLAVGVSVGDSVGTPVGVAVGTSEGTAVGIAVGVAVGAVVVGSAVGLAVGVSVGDSVGTPVGVAVGTSEGPAVGIAVGVAVGDSEGAAVGAWVASASPKPVQALSVKSVSTVVIDPWLPLQT